MAYELGRNAKLPVAVLIDSTGGAIVPTRAKPSLLELCRVQPIEGEAKLPELVADFCDYYAAHQNTTVVFYYDSAALVANYAVMARASESKAKLA